MGSRCGIEGASLARISAATGLGKGSLYHFFPGDKEEMAAAVLADIAGWFEANLYAPLEQGADAHCADAHCAIEATFDAVMAYFCSDRRVCLVGALALSDAGDLFAAAFAATSLAGSER